MKHPHLMAALAVAAWITVLGARADAQIDWSPSLDAALARAKSENRPVFIAIHADGERASDRIAAEHYRDRALAQLSRYGVNLFCSNDLHRKSGGCPRCKSIRCAEHRASDLAVRKQILKRTDDKPIQPPLHLFLEPGGKIIHSVAGYLTAGELEWMWIEAIRTVRSDFDATPGERCRAPERLRRGTASAEPMTDPPPGEAEVKEALAQIKKLGGGRGGWRQLLQDAQEKSRIIIRSDDKRALDWGRGTLRGYDRLRNQLLRDVGELSPHPWGGVVAEWLEDRRADTRKTAAIALEQLADPGAVAGLSKAARQEKEADVHGRMLRALAVSGPTDRGVIARISKAVESHEDPIVRAHATVAVGRLEKRDPIDAGLRHALQDRDPTVRSVAAYVIGIRRDKRQLQHLVASRDAETEASVKDWMDKAIAAVRTGETGPFAGFLGQVLDGNAAGSALDQLRDLFGERGKGRGEDRGGDQGRRK